MMTERGRRRKKGRIKWSENGKRAKQKKSSRVRKSLITKVEEPPTSLHPLDQHLEHCSPVKISTGELGFTHTVEVWQEMASGYATCISLISCGFSNFASFVSGRFMYPVVCHPTPRSLYPLASVVLFCCGFGPSTCNIPCCCSPQVLLYTWSTVVTKDGRGGLG